jgi:DeoR family fructose operon transcriptional repressor
MLQEERFVRIRNLLATFTQVSTERVARDLSVSRETARRDLVDLETLGALRRVHGGAVAIGPQPEAPLSVRLRSHLTEKRRIVKAALQLLSPGQTLFLDAGTTTSILAEELATLSGLTVVTNSLLIALKLSAMNTTRASGHDIILLGGHVSADTQAVYGDITVGEIHRYKADVAMLSPVGLNVKQGATSFEHHECAVARAMSTQAQRVIILADHSKIDQSSRVSYIAIADIDTIVTDSRARDLPGFTALQQSGRQMVVA